MSRDICSSIYADYIYSRIPAKVRSSFSEEQAAAIRSALAARDLSSQHGLDFRFSIPLFFRSYYFVILGGRDRRAKTLTLELMRLRRLPKGIRRSFYFLVTVSLIASFVLTILAGVYLIKSWAGIDLFTDFHLKDILPFDLNGVAKELLGGKR